MLIGLPVYYRVRTAVMTYSYWRHSPYSYNAVDHMTRTWWRQLYYVRVTLKTHMLLTKSR